MTYLTEITRFEAFAIYKHYVNKAKETPYLAEDFNAKAQKWLEIAFKIEQLDADNINKNLTSN